MIDTRLSPSPRRARAEPAGRVPVGAGDVCLWLLAAGLIWLVPAWYDRRALAAMAAWDVLVIVAVVLDFRHMPAPEALTVQRRWSGALTLGEPATVTIDVETNGSTVDLSLTDYPPGALRAELPALQLSVRPGTVAAGEYLVVPRERGDTVMGVVALRWQSGWRLAERRGIARLDQTVRVYPNREPGRREALFLVRSRQISIEKRRARYAGMGREFESLREHQPGDEPRDICWTAAARRGHLVTKVYQPERSQAVWILLDAGRLSRARSGPHTLFDHAVTGALTIAQVVMASGDKVGLLAYGRAVQRRLAPERGNAHLRRLLEALAIVRAENVEADHAGASAEMLRVQKRRALVVWLTEIAETAGVPDVIEQTTAMMPRHVVVFAVPRHAEMIATASEAPTSPARMYRGMAAQEALARRHALLAGVRQRGALVVEASPADLGGGLVNRYLEVKARGLL
jgi:uncharacterized protein (DUF58 family)